MAAGDKDPGALLTIGELSRELGVAQHILRYWETRFPQLKPMQRAGNRRYYRPNDVDLVRRIHRLLDEEGYTVRGVQKLLRDKAGARSVDDAPTAATPAPPVAAPASAGDMIQPSYFAPTPSDPETTAEIRGADFLPEDPAPSPVADAAPGIDVFRLIAVRNRLASLIDV